MPDRKTFTLEQWLDAYFDHPYEYGYFLDIDPLPISPQQEIDFIIQAFEQAEITLKPYSNGQLKQGLWLLAHEMHNLSDRFGQGVKWDSRQRCIQSFKVLNEQLYAKRCSPETSAYKNPAPDNPLNMICYMWWDIFAFWESIDADSTNRVDAEFLDVMANCLTIDHVAVIEGALHGLSHIPNRRQQVVTIIDNFLKQTPDLTSELKHYAQASNGGWNL
jgi:hypothetical protein